MTQQEIITVQRTWRTFRMMNPEVVGDVFYTKLFADMPSMQKIFKGPMREQYIKVVNMFSMIIGRLNNTDEVNDLLELLWSRQKKAGFGAVHFMHVKNALMWTLQHGLGADWTMDVKQAWDACYEDIAHRIFALAEFK